MPRQILEQLPVEPADLDLGFQILAGPLHDVFNCTDSAPPWRDFVSEYGACLKMEPKWREFSATSVLLRRSDAEFIYMYTSARFGAQFPNTKLFARIDHSPEFSWQEGVLESVQSSL